MFKNMSLHIMFFLLGFLGILLLSSILVWQFDSQTQKLSHQQKHCLVSIETKWEEVYGMILIERHSGAESLLRKLNEEIPCKK